MRVLLECSYWYRVTILVFQLMYSPYHGVLKVVNLYDGRQGNALRKYRLERREMKVVEDFSQSFNVATDKDCLVSFVLQMEDGRVTWSPNFYRNFKDWELGRSVAFVRDTVFPVFWFFE